MDALPTHRCVPDSRDHSRNVSKRRLFGEGGEDRQSEACEDGGEDERCSQCNDQILPIMAHRIVKAVHAGFAQTLSHHVCSALTELFVARAAVRSSVRSEYACPVF